MKPALSLNTAFNKEVELIIGSITAAQSFFLSFTALLERRNNRNVLLGAFFLAITLRIVKSLLWVSLDDLPLWAINTGFLAHSLTGPLLLLYTRQTFARRNRLSVAVFHFVPAMLLLCLIPQLTLEGFWYKGGYSLLVLQQLGYALACLGTVLWQISGTGRGEALGPTMRRWLYILVLGTLLLQTAYFSNYILGLTPYLLGPLLYAPFVYLAGWYAYKNPGLLTNSEKPPKYKNIKASPEVLQTCSQRLTQLMADEKPYLESSCTLGRVAQKIHVPSYLLSHLINTQYATNFPDYINRLRIQKAKELFCSPDFARYKISSIAHEIGFNSLSSFNAAFKKCTGVTPSAYKEQMTDS